MMPDGFSLLFVCTGNICRSAQAEQLTRARLERLSPDLMAIVTVLSAGTGALVDAAMPEEAAELLRRHGGTPENHRGRQLTRETIRGADLVLTMNYRHRRETVKALPRASRNTFLLTEFAVMVEDVAQHIPQLPGEWNQLGPGDRLREVVRWVAGRRGLVGDPGEEFPEIVDPFRRRVEVYEQSAAQLVTALDRIESAALQIAAQVAP